MNTLTRTTAVNLTKGMTFELSKTECLIIDIEKNNFDHMVVRFVLDARGLSKVGFMVVPEDFPFDIQS